MTSVLDIKMQPNDADASTVKDYLKALLARLWEEGEGFSGKRPFGNSGWEYELYVALVSNGIVRGSLTDDGYIEDCDVVAVNALIYEAICSL